MSSQPYIPPTIPLFLDIDGGQVISPAGVRTDPTIAGGGRIQEVRTRVYADEVDGERVEASQPVGRVKFGEFVRPASDLLIPVDKPENGSEDVCERLNTGSSS